MLVIVIWKDIQPRGGGTFIAPDSIKPVAEYLLADQTGIHPFIGGWGDLITQCHDFREVTGKAGDVILMHPYMLHASSQNHCGIARFITNPPVALREPMNFNRENPDDFSPVEQAVLHALGVERLDYHPQASAAPSTPKPIARLRPPNRNRKANRFNHSVAEAGVIVTPVETICRASFLTCPVCGMCFLRKCRVWRRITRIASPR